MEINSEKYKKTEVIKAKDALIRLRNLSIIMKLLFKTPAEIMREKPCDLDNAMEQQEKAYNYIKKYAVIHTKDAVDNAKPIIEQLLEDILKEEENNKK